MLRDGRGRSTTESVVSSKTIGLARATGLQFPVSTLVFRLHVRQAKRVHQRRDPSLFVQADSALRALFLARTRRSFSRALQPGDILLIEGNTRLSAIIKFLTQSTWSHAALYVGERPVAQTSDGTPDGEPNVLLEAEVEHGVTTVPLSKYSNFNKRICRPVGLEPGRQAEGRRLRLGAARQTI